MFDMKKAGEKIYQLRKKCGITQFNLAQELNISCQAVSNWERGITMPDISNLKKLAEVLNTTVDYILGDQIVYETLESGNNGDSSVERGLSPDDAVAKAAYASGDLALFSELVESLSPDALSGVFETAYKEGNISFIAEMADFVSPADIKNCALYAYKTGNLSVFSEITDQLTSENKQMLLQMAILDRRTSFAAQLME